MKELKVLYIESSGEHDPDTGWHLHVVRNVEHFSSNKTGETFHAFMQPIREDFTRRRYYTKLTDLIPGKSATLYVSETVDRTGLIQALEQHGRNF